MITERTPSNWKDLQDCCAQILSECGLQTYSPRIFEGLRNNIEVDVFAEGAFNGRSYSIVIECKNWSSKVPQEVVHAFRTVMVETGANIGYLVSKSGFQSGAYQAATNTNIKLLNWFEFQNEFFEQWVENYFRFEVYKKYDSLISYLEPLPAMASWDSWLEDEDVEILIDMFNSNQNLARFLMTFMPYTNFMKSRVIFSLPLSDHLEAGKGLDIPEHIRNARGYRELLTALESYCLPLLERFRSFRDKAIERKEAGEPKFR